MVRGLPYAPSCLFFSPLQMGHGGNLLVAQAESYNFQDRNVLDWNYFAMNYREWLLTEIGRKASTARDYYHAIYKDSINSLLVSAGLSPLFQATSSEQVRHSLEVLMQLEEFRSINRNAHNRYTATIRRYVEYMRYLETADLEKEDVSEIENLADLTETQRNYLISCRLCQGEYRQQLLDLWEGRCSVTSVSQNQMLIASHIKPWRLSNARERTAPANGLLLIPQLDRAFDQGLITFHETSGKIVISPHFEEYEQTGIFKTMKLRMLPPDTKDYLEFHRENIFLS